MLKRALKQTILRIGCTGQLKNATAQARGGGLIFANAIQFNGTAFPKRSSRPRDRKMPRLFPALRIQSHSLEGARRICREKAHWREGNGIIANRRQLIMNFRKMISAAFASILLLTLAACDETRDAEDRSAGKIHVIFDTDANNEVDDQHALAYLLFSGGHFNVIGVTVNATSSPDGFSTESEVRDHYDEARRVMQLCGELYGKIPLLTGAQGSFEEIRTHLADDGFDGHEAVRFIIEEALKERDDKLVLLPVGKLTNIALALEKEPAIAENVRIVWLGSNYPRTGEHNKVWDKEAMKTILDVDVPFEFVTVRYGDPSGTDAVKVTQAQILHRMPGLGPKVSKPVTGRHGGEFDNWGDYSANLFEMYSMYGDPPSRALFDMAAVAILKNPGWAERRAIPAPILDIEGDVWVERPENPRQLILWEWFDIYGIMNDFFLTMENPVLVNVP
jgi:purine nucleosidase